METWWLRKPWWSSHTNGKLAAEIGAFVVAFCFLYFSDVNFFRMIVAVYLASRFGGGAGSIVLEFRKQ